jgi:8-oxo-dGTP pyrophosphatase MutT (NUDIX family)
MWDSLHLLHDLELGEVDHLAAVLAPLYEDGEGEVRVVLTKRPDTMPTHAGHISFPGGRAHPGDSGPIETALREAHEEVGIEPDSVEILGYLPPIDTVEFKPWVVPVVGRVATPLLLVPSEREVARIHTPKLSDLADVERWWHVPWDGRQVWYYDLDGDTLWGATAHMVRSLLGLPEFVPG